jgi:GTP-binding protein
MSSPLPLVFVAATVDAGQLPESSAEVVFLGRSNVGKSSLLNALANKKDLAHVSKTPGRTQVLACFRLDPGGGTLVDCPGYGYANAPKGKRDTWVPMIEDYLLRREPLRMVLLLVDGEIGPTASDVNMLGWLRESELPLTVVATKFDRVKPSQRRARQREVAEKCRLPEADVVWVSAIGTNGVDRLRDLVRGWLQDDGR